MTPLDPEVYLWMMECMDDMMDYAIEQLESIPEPEHDLSKQKGGVMYFYFDFFIGLMIAIYFSPYYIIGGR